MGVASYIAGLDFLPNLQNKKINTHFHIFNSIKGICGRPEFEKKVTVTLFLTLIHNSDFNPHISGCISHNRVHISELFVFSSSLQFYILNNKLLFDFNKLFLKIATKTCSGDSEETKVLQLRRQMIKI